MKKTKILLSVLLLLNSAVSYGMNIDDYINYVSRHNLDIKKAELTYKQAELNYNGSKIDQHPQISSTLVENKTDNNQLTHAFTTSLSYNLDIWGQLNDTEKSKLTQVEAAAQNLEDTKNQIIYKFIDYYLQLANTNERISIENEKLNKYLIKLEIIESQYKNGYVNIDKVLVIKNNVLDIKNVISTLVDTKNNLITNLNILLNQKPADSILVEPKEFNAFVELHNPDQNILSAVERNPLIKAELLNILASDYMIKYNEKSYYPTINLNGSLTDSVLKISNLLSNPILAILSTVKVNFNYNEIENNIKLSKITKELTENSYQLAYITLFNNITETISKYQNANSTYLKITNEYANYEKITDTYTIQYKNGYLPYNTLLDAEILLLNTKESVLNSKLTEQQVLNKLNYYIN